MKSHFIRWLRLTLPEPAYVILFLIGIGTLEAIRAYVQFQAGPQGAGIGETMLMLHVTRDAWLVVTAFSYGVFRVIRFHPLASAEYRRWLEVTPWTSRLPLPRGPAQLVPQDLLVLCVLMACCWDTPNSPLLVPAALFLGYLLALAVTFLVLDQRLTGYLLLFGLGSPFVDITQPLWGCLGLALCYPLGAWGLQQSLRKFPWKMQEGYEIESMSKASREEAALKKRVGFPWDHLGPGRKFVWCPALDAVCVPLLAAWWAWLAQNIVEALFMARGGPPLRGGFPTIIFFPYLFFFPLGRWAAYIMSFKAPLNLLGRISTGRLIIPRYDMVLVGPLLGVLCPAVMAGLWLAKIVPSEAVLPGAVGSMLFFLMSTGPTFREWELTGHHQLTPGEYKAQKKAFLEL